MKLLRLTQKAYEKYKETVKGNKNISHDQAARKLSRNVQLVIESATNKIKRNWFMTTYEYGNLEIRVMFGTIVDIKNHKGRIVSWRFPKGRYIELTEEYGIEDNKFHE